MPSGRSPLERLERLERAGTPPEERLFGRRTRLILLTSTAYVAADALRAVRGEGARGWGAALLALWLAWVAGGREPGRGLAEWGLALAVASFGAPDEQGWVAVLGVAGAAVAALAANGAMARVSAPDGIARPRVRSPQRTASALFGFVVLGVLFVVALSARVLHAVGNGTATGLFASQADLFAFVACLLAGVFLVGEAWDIARVRRLELGVAARMHAAAGLGTATAGVAWGVWFVGFAPAEAIARVAVALGAVLVCHVALRGDPVALARASRRAMALTIVGGPIVLLGAAVAQGRPWDSAAVVTIFGVLALGIGASAAWIEEPLRPARGAWLDAAAAAHEALLRTDPDEAVREALVALRAPAGLSASSPELWTFDPLHVTTVDAAGYAHVHGAEATATLPEGMIAVAAGEPEAILRCDVLEALSIRRPELRPYARWMDDHGAMLAAVVTRAGEAEGLLVLPRGKRTAALTLEEARAIKRLADALAALCHARAALARSLAREREATERAEKADRTLGGATAEITRRHAQHVLAAERLARPAFAGIYSASARFAVDAIEETLRAGRPLFVHAPAGIDAVPYVAKAHLASTRRGEALVVVDGASTREHELARWSDPLASPIALADRGVLLLVDVGALPVEVQKLVARAHSEHRGPWEQELPVDFVLAVTSRVPLAELMTRGRLDAGLAAQFTEEASASLPRLRDRPEDLRAILSDRLAREGLRVRGAPVGIEDAAFARLLEYPFEGEDAELASMALQLVASCEGDVVRAHHVDALIARERERGDDRKAKRALELEGRARDPADVVEPRS
ncbi:MAG: hypothetical protein ACLQBL_15015 [Polyangiaceae bacterium]